MSEQSQVILDTSQAKSALAELEARLKSLENTMSGMSAGKLTEEYKRLQAGAASSAASINKLSTAKGTSASSLRRYRAELNSTVLELSKLKVSAEGLEKAIADQGKASDKSKAAMVSYRAVIEGQSYSFREASKYSQAYVKDLAQQQAAMRVQKAAAAEQADMLAGMYKMRDSYQKMGRTISIAEEMDRKRTTALQKAQAKEQADMLKNMYAMRDSYQKLGRQWSLAEQMDQRRSATQQKLAAKEQADMLKNMYAMRESYQKLGRQWSMAEEMDRRRTTAVQKAQAKEQADMLKNMYAMRESYQKLGRQWSLAEQMDQRRTAAQQKLAAKEQADMLKNMYAMRESYQKLGRQWSMAEEMDRRRTNAVQKAQAKEQADMLKNMYAMRDSYQKLGRQWSIAEQMDQRRTAAQQKIAAKEQADMLKNMYAMRDSYRSIEQRRDAELYRMREGEARKYRLINEKRDLEEYTMRQAHLRRMAALERKWLEAGPRGQASQAMRARRLMDGGMDASKFYAPQAIEAARNLKVTDDLSSAMGRLGHAYRAGGGHAMAFTESQHAVHSALRGVSGALGALWLTYGKYVAVMAAASAATVAASKSFKQGAELGYQARFAAILSNDGPAPQKEIDMIRDQLIAVTDGTKFNALEAAEGLRVLAQTGVKAKDGLGMLNTIMAATIFGETDMKTATEGLTSALYQFNMMTDDAKTNATNISDIGDAMAYVSVQTKAGMADVAESFKTTTGLAQRYGITVQETAVLLEKIGKRGLVGGNAGTLLRNMVEDLLGSPNNRNAAKIREALGMGMFEKGKDSPLAYLQQVFEKYRALNAAQKQAFDANMLNERGRRPFSILAEESENLTDALKTLEERSDGLLDKLVSGLEGDVKLAFQAAGAALENSFMSAIEGSEDSLLQLANMLEETFRSEGFRGGLRDFISLLSDAARWVTENTELIKQLAIGYAVFKGAGLMVGVIGSFLKVKDALGGIGTAAGVAQGGLTGLASRLENVARIFTSNPILLRFIQFASTNPAILAGAVPATIALNIVAKDLSMPSKEDYAEGARNKIGLTSNTSIEDLDADAARTALQKSNSELDRYNAMSWHTRNSLPDYETIKRDNAALKERVDYFNELARFAGKTPPEPPKVIKRDGGGPEDGPGAPFNLGGGGGRQNFDRTPLREVQSATKLANAEYDQAMASIEFYKQGLDLRKNARMVGEKEYQQTLDALAELEIQKGIEREDAIQRAIEAALPKVKDSSMREQLMGDMEASLQKEQTLMTKAYTDKALAQLKAEVSRKEFLEEIEKLEAESFGTRLTAQQQFIKDWNANNQALMDRAMADGDMESFMRLLNIKDRGMEDAKKEDNSNLASLLPGNTRVQLTAALDQYREYYTQLETFRQQQYISEEEYATALIELETRKQRTITDLHIQAAQERLDLGTGGWDDVALTALARVQEGFTTFSAGTASLLADFHQTFTDGFANSIGRAIVYADDFRSALASVAQEGLSQLISGLVKLGVQWMVNAAIGNTIQATAAASSAAVTAAQAAAAASAWAPAAALASLATSGANATPAMIGMSTATSLAQAIAATSYAGAFDKGGIIPSGKWGIVGEFGPEIVSGPANVTSREKTAEMARQAMAGSAQGTGSAEPPQVNLRIVNVTSDDAVESYLQSSAGERVLTNFIQRNANVIRSAVG